MILHHGPAHGGKAGTSSTTSRCSTRTTPCPARGRAPKSRSSRACTCARLAPKATRVQLLGSGTILRESWRPRSCCRLGRAGQRLELPQLQRTGPRRPGRRALEPAAPAGRPRVRGPASWAPRRPGGGVHRLHEELRRADPPVHPQGAGYRCWAPTALAAATSAASCASTSRSTATTSSWPRSRR